MCQCHVYWEICNYFLWTLWGETLLWFWFHYNDLHQISREFNIFVIFQLNHNVIKFTSCNLLIRGTSKSYNSFPKIVCIRCVFIIFGVLMPFKTLHVFLSRIQPINSNPFAIFIHVSRQLEKLRKSLQH